MRNDLSTYLCAAESEVFYLLPGRTRPKYNTWYYGREVSGDSYPWCVVFVWWCCAKAGVVLPVKTASCTALMNAAKQAGIWVTSGYLPEATY
ncbi:hypothetical protein [Oscillibacter sp. GMB15532]|uniref:hypothetical protein n=1 Tax=Oscillibacter sp. GMB15532 TaxID=3230022 RepID=UPI0034DF482C